MQNFNDYYFFREVAELMNPDSNIKFNSNGHRLIQAVSSEFEPTGMVPSEPMIQPQSPPSPQIPHKSGFNRWFSKKSAPQMI